MVPFLQNYLLYYLLENMGKSNIIISTFHCVPNYGAVLQAFCLQEYLGQYADQVQILNYCPRALTDEYKNINSYSLGSIVMSILTLPNFLKKKKAFKNFEHNCLKLTSSKYFKQEHIADFSDYSVVVGSDQIWNPQITAGFDSVYFGQWPASKVSKIVSYAASIGKGNYSDEEKSVIKRLLEKVHAISVRENEANTILTQELNICKPVTTVLDPTLLAGASILQKLVKPVSYKKYLLIYNLTGNPILNKLAEEVALKKGLRIVEICGKRVLKKSSKEHTIILDAGPIEFVSLFNQADYVVTDSFHGTAFSIIFHRPFITVPHKTRGSRMINLLSKAGLIDRLSDSFSDSLCNQTIDWNSVDENIAKERAISEKFIRENIL